MDTKKRNELKRNGFKVELKDVFSFRPFRIGLCCGACPFSTNKTTFESTKCLIFNFMPCRPFQSVCNIAGSENE